MAEGRRHVKEELAEENAVLVLHPISFPKKGSEAGAVQRPCSGRRGKIDHCQVGVLLCDAAAGGHAPLDRRLYLPQDWATRELTCPPRGRGSADRAELLGVAGPLPHRTAARHARGRWPVRTLPSVSQGLTGAGSTVWAGRSVQLAGEGPRGPTAPTLAGRKRAHDGGAVRAGRAGGRTADGLAMAAVGGSCRREAAAGGAGDHDAGAGKRRAGARRRGCW